MALSLALSLVAFAAATAGGNTLPRQRLVLSSGFLCFSNHCGVARLLEDMGQLTPERLGCVVGTSSGAIVGAMIAAGLSSDEIIDVITARRPIALCRPTLTPWRGLFSSSSLGRVLAEVLPARFDQLKIPFACGVARYDHTSGKPTPVLLTDGPLVEAVLASCAVPSMFQPVVVGGAQYVDGGIVDRTFVEGSRKWLRAVAPDVQQTVVSLITDVEGCAFGTRDGIRDLSGLAIVRTRRTKQSLVGRFEGTFVAEVDMAAAACAAVLGLAPS